MFFLLIIVLVILISTCDVLCEAHNRWPYGYDRDDEGYKVIPGFAGENGNTKGYGGDDIGRGAYGGGSNGRR